jgi:hypothetical protein
MRIFDALLGSTPKWARQLPTWLRPPASQIRRIEAIRRRFGIPHPDLFAFIAGHAVSSRRTMELHYKQLQQNDPSATEGDVLTALLWSRVLSGLATNDDLFKIAVCPDGGQLTSVCSIDHPGYHEHQARSIALSLGSFERLCAAVLKEEVASTVTVPPLPAFEQAVREIERILQEA